MYLNGEGLSIMYLIERVVYNGFMYERVYL